MKKKYQGRNLMEMLDKHKTEEVEQEVIEEVEEVEEVNEDANDEVEQDANDEVIEEVEEVEQEVNDEVNDDVDYDYTAMSSEEISKALAVASKSFITTHGTFGNNEESHKMKAAKLDKLMKTLAKSDEFREEIAQRTTPLPVILAVGVLIRAMNEGLIADFPEVKKHLDTLSDGDKGLQEEFTHYLQTMSFDIGTTRVKDLTNVSLYDFIYRSHGESESEKLEEKRILSTSPLQHNFLPYDEILADDSSGRAEIDIVSSISDEELAILKEHGLVRYLSATGRVKWLEMTADSKREFMQRKDDEDDDLSDFYPQWKVEQRTFDSASALSQLKRDHEDGMQQGFKKDMELEKWAVSFEDTESAYIAGFLLTDYREKVWYNEVDKTHYILEDGDEDRWEYFIYDYLIEKNKIMSESHLSRIYGQISSRWELPRGFTAGRVYDAVKTFTKEYSSKNPVEECLTLYEKAIERGEVEQVDEDQHEQFIDEFGELRESYARDALRYLFRKILVKNQSGDNTLYEDQEMLILVGRQGIGKSKLSQIFGFGYYTEDLDLSQRSTDGAIARDAMVRMASTVVSLVDEIGSKQQSSFKNLDALKSNIQKTTLKARLPYAKMDEIIYQRQVYLGSSNNENFLKDSTGNRRFQPIWVDNLPWTTHEDFIRVMVAVRREMLDIMTENGYQNLSQVKHRFTLEEAESHEAEKMMYYGSHAPVHSLYEAVFYDIYSQDHRLEGLGLAYGENRNGTFVHVGSSSKVGWERFWQKFIGDRNGKRDYYTRVGDVTEQLIYEEMNNPYGAQNFLESAAEPMGLTRIGSEKVYGYYLEDLKARWPVVFRREFSQEHIDKYGSSREGQSSKVEHIGMFSTIHGK